MITRPIQRFWQKTYTTKTTQPHHCQQLNWKTSLFSHPLAKTQFSKVPLESNVRNTIFERIFGQIFFYRINHDEVVIVQPKWSKKRCHILYIQILKYANVGNKEIQWLGIRIRDRHGFSKHKFLLMKPPQKRLKIVI